MRMILTVLLSFWTGLATAGELEDEIIGYMDFATEAEGLILPEQVTEDIFNDVFFVDTRSLAHYQAGTINGAVHIEWREVPRRLDELPTTGIFKRTRNPIYLSDVLVLLGLILRFDAVLSLLFVPVLVWLLERRFIVPEENSLRRRFSEEYAGYISRVRRWV